MRSRDIILKKSFVLVGYFLGIPLLVRVKTPILKDTLKKYPTRKVFFSKDQNPWIKDKTKKEVLKKW